MDVDKDFDAEIKHTEQRLIELAPQMDAALIAWLDATASWVADFWNATAQRIVTASPDAVTALSDESRRSVKAEAATLAANARVHIQRRLVDERKDSWPHLKPQTEVGYHPQGGNTSPFLPSRWQSGEPFVPGEVGAALNSVLGDLGPIFEPHGFKTYPLHRSEAHHSGYHWWVSSKESPEWSPEMVDRMRAYGELHKQWLAVLQMRRDTEEDMKKTQAADLWKSA